MNEYDRRLVQKAIIRWRGFDSRSQICLRDLHEFATFIGHPYDPKKDKIVDTGNPEVCRIIDLINGPNGDTILKIMEIRKNDSAEEKGCEAGQGHD